MIRFMVCHNLVPDDAVEGIAVTCYGHFTGQVGACSGELDAELAGKRFLPARTQRGTLLPAPNSAGAPRNAPKILRWPTSCGIAW